LAAAGPENDGEDSKGELMLQAGQDKEVREKKRIMGMVTLLAIAIFIFDLTMPRGVAAAVPYIAVVLLAIKLADEKIIIAAAVGVSVLTGLDFFLSSHGGELWKVVLNRFITIGAIWATAILGLQKHRLDAIRERAVREREQAIADLKVLRGLLPICASCKKIRDDKGYWHQLEMYIRDHSEAEFTHGLCADCAAKLYPDLILRQK